MEISKETIKLVTSNLALTKSIQISDGALLAFNSADDSREHRIEVVEKGVLGQISNYVSSSNTKRDLGGSNPQVVEHSIVPPNCDRFKVAFSMVVAPLSVKPYATNSFDVAQSIEAICNMYSEKGGYRKLAASYLYNIANGGFVWRNRFYAESASVTIEFNNEKVVFNALDLGIGDLSPALTTQDVEAVLVHASDSSENVTKLVDAFENALSGKGKILSCKVTWVSEVEELSEVFPSQEYVRESKREEGKNKILSGVMIGGRKYATIHSQKIGAAIRNIDNWHGSDKTVPINPYAGDKQTGLALRSDAKTSPTLYDIMKKPEVVIESLTSACGADEMDYSVHFLIANFIRGGVFGIQDNAKS